MNTPPTTPWLSAGTAQRDVADSATRGRSFMHVGRKQHVELRVLSRQEAERYEPRGVEICISIGDPHGPPAQLSTAFAAVLRLAFNDIVAAPAAEDILFDAEHAADILQFMERWPHAERIVVHCGAGASRSPGVALGLCDAFGWPVAELERAFPSWNRRVRTVIAQRAFG